VSREAAILIARALHPGDSLRDTSRRVGVSDAYVALVVGADRYRDAVRARRAEHAGESYAATAQAVGCSPRVVVAILGGGRSPRAGRPDAPRPPVVSPPRADAGEFLVWDLSDGRPYLDIGYPTAMAACAALHDLLRPYERGSSWRSCLVVVRREPRRIVHALERREVRPTRPIQEVLL
jgi:hypothetical protein